MGRAIFQQSRALMTHAIGLQQDITKLDTRLCFRQGSKSPAIAAAIAGDLRWTELQLRDFTFSAK